MSYLPPIMQALLLLGVVPAAIVDLRARRVPNWLTLTTALLGIALNFFLFETPGLWMSLKGMGLAMLIYFPLYVLRGMGAGDVKLMAAVGAIAGPANWLGILVLTASFGAVAAIVLVVSKRRVRKTVDNMSLILVSILHRQAPYAASPHLDIQSDEGARLPHAAVIACGCIAFLIAAGLWAPR
jgi:prepilin peptidase CpaA